MAYGSILGQQYIPTPITSVGVTLSSSAWVGSSAPYTISITVQGVTATSYQILKPASNITSAQLETLQAANIQEQATPQSANTINLRAFGTKPEIDIPIEVVLLGE